MLDCVLPHFLMQYKWFNKNSYWLSWSHLFKGFTVGTMTWLTVMEYLCLKWSRKCSICRKHFPVITHLLLITGFVTRLTRRVPLVEQELLTFLGHMSSLPVYSGIRVTRSLVLCLWFVDRCLSLCVLFRCLSFFDWRILITYLVSSNSFLLIVY